MPLFCERCSEEQYAGRLNDVGLCRRCELEEVREAEERQIAHYRFLTYGEPPKPKRVNQSSEWVRYMLGRFHELRREEDQALSDARWPELIALVALHRAYIERLNEVHDTRLEGTGCTYRILLPKPSRSDMRTP